MKKCLYPGIVLSLILIAFLCGCGGSGVSTSTTSKSFAYVTNSGSNTVSIYSINQATGALTAIGTVAAGTQPWSIDVGPSGKYG
jgi:YVTN family beta-propeller protein